MLGLGKRQTRDVDLSFEEQYAAMASRDRRFDGVFIAGVRTTGIYCRPSCPARTPKQANVSFFPSAAAAQAAGLRACRRCLPNAAAGSPEWDLRADTADRAMRLIADGVVDREGIEGLARRLGYSVRHLNRIVTAAWGAGPLALSRSRRAQTARILIDSTSLSMSEIAFASGFGSLRQFNDTLREVYAVSPSHLRSRRHPRMTTTGAIHTRVGVREPFDAQALLSYLSARAVPGLESADSTTYSRLLGLPHGPARLTMRLSKRPVGAVECAFDLTDMRDLAPALERTRRLLDADCDPIAVRDALGRGALAPVVERHPGLRVPGHVDGWEVAARAVLGQQVTLAAARTLTSRLAELGPPTPLGRLFPGPEVVADLPDAWLPMPRSRTAALRALANAVAHGEVALDRSAPRAEVASALLSLPGIGPWTAGYIAMRALGDTDVLLTGDTGTRAGARALGLTDLAAASARWRPWRSYAQIALWTAAAARPRSADARGSTVGHKESR